MTRHEGGCLCGRIRYATLAAPAVVNVCHYRFCQKATGSDYMVEPIFAGDAFVLLKGSPRIFDHRSEGSGTIIQIHFCGDCGTRLWLTFERFPDSVGIYAGTFDDPCWFEIEPASSKHVFLGSARSDTVIPAGLPTFVANATATDGTAEDATVFEAHHRMGS